MARRRTQEESERLIEDYRASGLSQLAYSRQTGAVLSTLRRYLRRRTAGEQHLLQVNLESPSEAPSGFALVLGNGRRIESNWRFAESELARLIRVAESA